MYTYNYYIFCLIKGSFISGIFTHFFPLTRTCSHDMILVTIIKGKICLLGFMTILVYCSLNALDNSNKVLIIKHSVLWDTVL